MKTQSAAQLWRNILNPACVAFAACALAACGNGSTASDPAVAAASADGSVSAKAGDPAANDASWRAHAVANGVITARKACDLLTREDSEAAVGQPLPQNNVNLTLGTCDYNAADFSAGASVTVSSWESIKNAATGGSHQPQAISGIGDEALYFAGSEKGGSPPVCAQRPRRCSARIERLENRSHGERRCRSC